jgi:anti-sigma B factor antagonist
MLMQIIPSTTGRAAPASYPPDAVPFARRAIGARPGQTGSCNAHASCGNHHRVGLLDISVAAGEAGPVLALSGEADLTTVAELTEALTAQLANGAPHLTVDLSRLRFADSAVIRALVLADRTLKKRGGGLALTHPRPVVARALSLLGVDQAIEIRNEMSAGADPNR